MKKQLSKEARRNIEKYLRLMIEWFCRYPDEAQINFVQGTHSSIIEIHPHPEDIGAMIGREGSVASGIRSILGAYSRIIDHKLHSQIIEVGLRPRRRRRDNFQHQHKE